MDFGEALAALKRGVRVARAGWNGKGMWLTLVRPDRGGPIYGSPPARIEPRYGVEFPSVRDGDYPHHQRAAYPTPRLLPWIGMKTADDGFVPWLASQTDILAEDWEIVS